MNHCTGLMMRLAVIPLLLLVAPAIAQVPPEPDPALAGIDDSTMTLLEQIEKFGAPRNFVFPPVDTVIPKVSTADRQTPNDLSLYVFSAPRPSTAWASVTREFNWEPTNFFHQPLYWDDVPLERYGQTLSPHLQPVISSTRFFLTFPVIPYKIGVDHPYDCVTTLGYFRPGACAPCIKETLPLELDASLLQAATTVGLVFLLP